MGPTRAKIPTVARAIDLPLGRPWATAGNLGNAYSLESVVSIMGEATHPEGRAETEGGVNVRRRMYVFAIVLLAVFVLTLALYAM